MYFFHLLAVNQSILFSGKLPTQRLGLDSPSPKTQRTLISLFQLTRHHENTL